MKADFTRQEPCEVDNGLTERRPVIDARGVLLSLS